jgi:solute carrier family 6 GABA transporter-like protein 1
LFDIVGNVWRFPALAYKYGGGAFFIPYILALFLVGIPLLVLEFAMGQYYQMGHVGAFGSIHKRLRGVGLSAVLNGFFIVVYYTMLIGWVVNGFFQSFSSEVDWESMTGAEAIDYFFVDVMCMPDPSYAGRPTRMCWDNFGYLALTWVIVFLCLFWGLKWTGRLTYFTMGLPIVLLFVFLGRALTLPGAADGVKAYMGVWDLSVLTEQPDCWSTAVSQIFFSIGVTFGIMTSFGSHLERNEPAFANGCIVACSNSVFSIISGLAVFGSVGYLANQTGVPIEEVSYSGLGLVFGTWPVVLATLPGGEHWVRLLFFNLFLLGIDSAFALVEACLTVCKDTVTFRDTNPKIITTMVCVVGFVCGVMYTTDAGLLLLDAVDYYINFIMILIGFFEGFAGGWVYKLDEQIETFGKNVIACFFFTTFGSVILASGLWFGLKDIGAGFAGLIVSYAVGMAITLWMCRPLVNRATGEEGAHTWKSVLYGLYFKNVMDLRNDLAAVVGWIPVTWALLIKHFIPPVLLILFANLCASENSAGETNFWHYGGLPTWPYQVLGMLIVVLTCVLILTGMIFPNAYDMLSAENEIEMDNTRAGKMEETNPDVIEDTEAGQTDHVDELKSGIPEEQAEEVQLD